MASAMTPVRVGASHADTPNSMPARRRVNAAESATPIMTADTGTDDDDLHNTPLVMSRTNNADHPNFSIAAITLPKKVSGRSGFLHGPAEVVASARRRPRSQRLRHALSRSTRAISDFLALITDRSKRYIPPPISTAGADFDCANSPWQDRFQRRPLMLEREV